MREIYTILELANCHGGSIDYVNSLIEEFSTFNKRYGMKFQPFKFDKIATSDYEWYPVYQELFFNEQQWSSILNKANETKDIWLDLFDEYSILILKNNLDIVHGIKLQASVLNNVFLLNQLKETDLSKVTLAMNISGFEIDSIRQKINEITTDLKPKEVLLEIGFQAYPTNVADSGLNKIAQLKNLFSNRIVFADHVDGNSPDATWIPVLSVIEGADVIEKHIKHSKLETKYDHYSSIDFNKVKQMEQQLHAYINVKEEPFINEREKEYLSKTVQFPITKRFMRKGETINLSADIDYKRSNKRGLRIDELKDLLNNHYVLADDINENEVLQAHHFKKATVATIIAGRLKSTRLKRKALLNIGDITSVELCIKNCLNFRDSNHTILASSDLEEDAPLKDFTYRSDVLFHTGDPEDVIRRYLSICDLLKVDVVIRVTADMPYVAKEITALLLKEHFKSGADFTYASNASVGTSAEIVNVASLRKIKEHFPNAQYSEYMSWYFKNNPEHFKLKEIELPNELSRNYRLTIDHQEDLDMFNLIYDHFKSNDFTLPQLFEMLDNNPEIAKINANISLKYLTDATLIETLNRETKIK